MDIIYVHLANDGFHYQLIENLLAELQTQRSSVENNSDVIESGSGLLKEETDRKCETGKIYSLLRRSRSHDVYYIEI